MDGIFLIIESFVRQTIYSLHLEKREKEREKGRWMEFLSSNYRRDRPRQNSLN